MNSLPDPTELLIGVLAFLRIGAILFALPITGDVPTPVRARLLLSLAMTIGLYPIIPQNWAPNLSVDFLTMASYMFRELLIGLVIGYFGRVAFDGIMMAATVASFQMGFGTANLFLPDYSEKMDPFSAIHRMLVLLIFLSLSLHTVFLTAIADSFRLIPGAGAHMTGSLAVLVIKLTSGVFAIAIQLAAPVLVALLFTMAALGLIARTVPSMQVFNMSFPISFVIGLVIYMATLPFFPNWMATHFSSLHDQFIGLMRSLGDVPQHP